MNGSLDDRAPSITIGGDAHTDPMQTLFQQTFSDFDFFEGEYVEAKVLRGLFGLPVPPPKIGRFEIRERLGSGGMGEVYAAWDPELRRMVALKLDPIGRRERDELLREARVHARVESPHVLPVYDVGIHGDHVYMAMKIVQGRTLASWQSEDRSLAEILSVYAQAARGLAEIHRSGVIHCDFKPANVLVDRHDRVWVADFGLARFCPSDAGAAGGTRGYMAPERMFEQLSSTASDQFSFCVSLFEAVFRVSPFPGPRESYGQRLARCEVVFPPNARSVPKWLTALLERGLRRDPARRFPDMAALVDELSRERRNLALMGVWAPAFIVTVVLLVLAWRPRPEPASRVDSLAHVWDDSQRRQLHDHLAELDTPWIAASRPLIFRPLDDWAKRWRNEWWQAGVLHLFRLEDGRARFDCLFDQRAWLDQTVDGFLAAGPTLLWSAPLVTSDLPSPERCRQAVRGRPSHIDEATAARLQAELAHAHALRAAQRLDEGRVIVDGLVVDADDWPTLRIDALRERGLNWWAADRPHLAIEDLLLASDLAIEHEEWSRAADLHADVLDIVDSVADPETTERRIRGDLQVLEGEESVRFVEHLHALARALDARGRDFDDEAGTAYRVAIDRGEAILGPGHPQMADMLTDAGRHELDTGERRIARDRLNRALELRRASLPAYHPLIARSLLALAELERADGNLGPAVAFVHEALAHGCDREREYEAFALLGALHVERDEWSQAIEWYQRSLRAFPDFEDRYGAIRLELAKTLARIGDGEGAALLFSQP